MTTTVQRIESAILLQGSALAEVEWVLRRGVREIWRTDSIPPSAQMNAFLHDLRAMNAARGESPVPPAGSGEVPAVADTASLTAATISTAETARLLGVGPRQVRNLSRELAGRKVEGRLAFDLAAVQAEVERRKESA